MLNEVQQHIVSKQEGVIELFEETDEEERKDFFNLNVVKEKEMVLAELLETRKMPQKKFVPGETATFLTQVYKDSDLTQKELEEKFPNWAKARNIEHISQELINNHAKTKENVANQKKINDAKIKREKEVK